MARFTLSRPLRPGMDPVPFNGTLHGYTFLDGVCDVDDKQEDAVKGARRLLVRYYAAKEEDTSAEQVGDALRAYKNRAAELKATDAERLRALAETAGIEYQNRSQAAEAILDAEFPELAEPEPVEE